MTSYGFLPDATKPLPDAMLNCYQCGPVTFIRGYYHKKIWSYMYLRNLKLKILFLKSNPDLSKTSEFTEICMYSVIGNFLSVLLQII